MRIGRPRFTVRAMMILVAIAGFFCASTVWLDRHPLYEPSSAQVVAMGRLLINDIENWRSKHGRYPRTLREAKLISPTNYKGGLLYKSDATGFMLTIGKPTGRSYQHNYVSSGYKGSDELTGWSARD